MNSRGRALARQRLPIIANANTYIAVHVVIIFFAADAIVHLNFGFEVVPAAPAWRYVQP
jgi:hypothetical protein